jgi:hypothetical protein
VRRAAAAFCDLVLLLCAAAFVYLFTTGGGTLHLGPVAIRITSSRNLTTISMLAALVRCTWLACVPIAAFQVRPADLSARLHERFERATPVRWLVIAVIGVSVALRAAMPCCILDSRPATMSRCR